MTDPAAPGSAPLANPRRERFALEYVKDLNGAQAVMRAGYSAKGAGVQGVRLLADVNVSLRVAFLQKKIIARTELTAEWVLGKLVDIAERCTEPVPVRDAKGQVLPGEWTCDIKGATPALALLAKHLGLLVERVEHSGPEGGPIEVVDVTEVRARLADRIARFARTN